MHPVIKTAYRVVKQTEDLGCEPIFIPQYQQEETGEQWHTFTVTVKGRSGGHNTVYFYVLSKALAFIKQHKATADEVVHYEDLVDNWSESLPYGN